MISCMNQITTIEIQHQHRYFRMYMKTYSMCTFSSNFNRPLSSRPYRSSSVVTDGVANTPSTRVSISSNQEIPIIDRFVSQKLNPFDTKELVVKFQANGNSSQDNRLKRAAAQERRQATRKKFDILSIGTYLIQEYL